ncbi:MAG: hypothetical protein ABIJ40_17225 [Bacteroidota bacterium]|nr:hypothetical protein [Bacteroidota bacterium]
MNIKSISGVILIYFIITGCAAINMNHYQDGKTVGDGNFDAKVGIGTGLSFISDTVKVNQNNFEVKTSRGPSSVFLNLSVQGGATSNLDVGGEIFATLGSTGFKFFGKYALLDSTSKYGVALMPIIGFSFPWFEPDEDSYEYDSGEINFSVGSLILEFVMPMSYHPSEKIAFVVTPKAYFHHNFMYQSTGESVDLQRKGNASYFSPGISLGMKIHDVRFEGTLIHLNGKVWMPYFGFTIRPDIFF